MKREVKQAPRYVSRIPTPQHSTLINPNYDRSYDDDIFISDAGIVHPGMVHSREDLNAMRDMVWLGKGVWAEAFEKFRTNIFSSLDYQSSGALPVILSDLENYSLVRDSVAALQLTLMWYITGQQVYADKAKGLINDWASTLKEDKKKDLIRIGIALQKLITAAEILRYTPASGWPNEQELSHFNRLLNVFQDSVDRPDGFYNQGQYALSAYMQIAIFQDNNEQYADAVERFFYNKKGEDIHRGHYDVNFSLAAMVLDSGQLVEMGRDQGHAFGDIGLLGVNGRTIAIQGTKVNARGEIVAEGGMDPFEFQHEKILKAAAYIFKYNIGEEVEFEPRVNGLGQLTEWPMVSVDCRGEIYKVPVVRSIYNYYRYVKGYEPDQLRNDPHMPNSTYGDLYRPLEIYMDYLGLEGQHVDFPGFGELYFTPVSASADAVETGPPQALPEEVDRNDVYNRQVGSSLVASGGGNGGVITEPFDDGEGSVRFVTSDVNNEEWIAWTVDFAQLGSTLESITDTFVIRYGMNSHIGGDIEMRISDYIAEPETPDFQQATNVATFHIDNTGWYSTWGTKSTKITKHTHLLTGKKTMYLYFYGSSNVYNFHADTLWFKFTKHYSRDAIRAIEADVKSEEGYSVNADEAVTLTSGGYIGYDKVDFDNGIDQFVATIQATSGVLKLFCGDPEAGGQLFKQYELLHAAEKLETVFFTHSNKEQLYGNHNIYLQYEGDDCVTISSLSYTARVASFVPIHGGSYLHVVSGKADRPSGKDGMAKLSVTADAETKLTYAGVPFITGPSTLNVKVKSDTTCTLRFEVLSKGEAGIGTMASFTVPRTTSLTADGWITLQYDLTKTGYDNNTGHVFLAIIASGGEGTVEIDQFEFEREGYFPEMDISHSLEQVTLYAGLECMWNVKARDGRGQAIKVMLIDMPNLAMYDNASGDFTWIPQAADVGTGRLT